MYLDNSYTLEFFLPKLILPEQTGFLKGYDISTQVLLAREMIHLLDRGGSQLCLKLDMMKAFDRVSWEYLDDATQIWLLFFSCSDNIESPVQHSVIYFDQWHSIRLFLPLSGSETR